MEQVLFKKLTRGPGFESKSWEYSSLKICVVELCRL